jgi:hypothetical protein
MKLFLMFIIFASCLPGQAGVKLNILRPVNNPLYQLGIGSFVEIEHDKETMRGTFLGRMVNHEIFSEEFLLMDEKSGKVFLINSHSFRNKSRMHPLISTIDQTGSTCAAYAIYHLWQQNNELYSAKSPELNKTFVQERTRMKLLEEAISRYYLGRSVNLNLILNKFADRFNFKCIVKTFKDVAKAKQFVYDRTQEAQPVMIEFNIGPSMAISTHGLQDFETGTVFDNNLWVPRKKGEKNKGGHVVVAAGSFQVNGKPKVMVLDSNWNEPRVWDLSDYFPASTAIEEMIFHTCSPLTDL